MAEAMSWSREPGAGWKNGSRREKSIISSTMGARDPPGDVLGISSRGYPHHLKINPEKKREESSSRGVCLLWSGECFTPNTYILIPFKRHSPAWLLLMQSLASVPQLGSFISSFISSPGLRVLFSYSMDQMIFSSPQGAHPEMLWYMFIGLELRKKTLSRAIMPWHRFMDSRLPRPANHIMLSQVPTKPYTP